jgi:hypothetical protein
MGEKGCRALGVSTGRPALIYLLAGGMSAGLTEKESAHA